MKATGIVRPIDELGRIVIPKELRKVFGLKNRDSLEIFVDDDMIVLKKYAPACIFCDESDNLVRYGGKAICKNCIDAMEKMAQEHSQR